MAEPPVVLTAKGNFLTAGLLLLLAVIVIAAGGAVTGLLVPVFLLFCFFLGKGVFRRQQQRQRK